MTQDNLFAALRASFPADLDSVAIECQRSGTYTWRDLERATAMMANVLSSLDIPPGSRIAAQTEKSVESLLLYLATLRAGHVYVPLNTAYREAELAYFIDNAQPAVFVCAPSHFGWISKIAFRAGTRHVFSLGDERDGSLLQRAALASNRHEIVPRQADDLAAIIYTSGTTGRSKGAMLSHGNLLANARVLQRYWNWQPGDVLIHALPIFHVHGLFVASHGALLNGSPMIWFPRFEPGPVIEAMSRATVFMGVPTLYVRLLADQRLSRSACAGMRLFVSGSAPLLTETFNAFASRTGHTILERYGMSETLMLTSNAGIAQDGLRKAGTVGKPLPGVEVRIVDERGGPVAAGDIGGIEVRGPSVFSGYWRMPEKTREEFSTDDAGHQWFRTGDVGRWDEDGHLVIVGRSKDLVITGGYNVYPAEVEGYINELDWVAESAVIGVPHPDFGEAVVAVIAPRSGVATPDPRDIIATLKSRIANYKVPKHAFVVDELPRNAMGKVQKNLLREQHADLFT